MKKIITKQFLIDYIKSLDVRCKKFDDTKFDDIIDDGFNNVNADRVLFFDEEAVGVGDYIADGTEKFTHDVERDVTYIYDAFLSEDSINPIYDSDNMVEIDPRVVGRINIDFNSTVDKYKKYTYHDKNSSVGTVPSVLIIRYAYIPMSDFDSLFVARDLYKAIKEGIAVATYEILHEEVKSSGHRSSMKRAIAGVIAAEPLDYPDELEFRKFIYGC